MPHMTQPNWAEALSAWSTFATAVLTLVLVALAGAAWRVARRTLDASSEASDAARVSAEAARAANEQARIDSIEQTRPYVYAEIVPGLAGGHTWDIRIRNVGRSAARGLRLECDSWPENPDKVTDAVRQLFETTRTLPPDCSIRAIWRLEGNFTDGTTEVGMGRTGLIKVFYSSDDPSKPTYSDTFEVLILLSGFTPLPEDGPEPTGLHGDGRRFYLLGQTLIRRVGELGR